MAAGPLLSSLVLVPHVVAGAEVAHDLGLDPHVRGTVSVDVDVQVVAGEGWHADVHLGARSFIRSNDPLTETLWRVSPEQVHYPVAGRLRIELEEGRELGLFVRHQSNHDVDSRDERLARETIAWEQYGVEWVGPGLRLVAALVVDRGTTLQGVWQSPFDRSFAGGTAEWVQPLLGPWYTAGTLDLVVHRDGGHSPPWLDVAGHLDTGVTLPGRSGDLRLFLRLQRVESYRHLDEPARTLLLLGLGVGGCRTWGCGA